MCRYLLYNKGIRVKGGYVNLKKDILILAALIAVVIAVPFLATKAEEAIQIKNEEFKEKQNRECYEKAEECMDAGKYDEAIELLEKLPGYYEDVEYIIQYAKFCDAVQNGEGIEELYKLIWYVPKGDEYSSKYIEEMRKAQKDTEEQYKKYMAQKEKEEEEKMRKKDEPYKGMKEKYINITLMGRAKEKRTEHYWRDTPGKRTQDIQYRYMWYNSNGAKKFMAVCRNGRVSSVVEFVSSTTSGKKTYRGNTSRNNDRKDMYDVQDYDDPEDFYYDHADEFDDIQDAEDYWEEAQ
nr:MAG TPA: Tetratricopeptide repeat-like domain [Caudoviricetes sp.]